MPDAPIRLAEVRQRYFTVQIAVGKLSMTLAFYNINKALWALQSKALSSKVSRLQETNVDGIQAVRLQADAQCMAHSRVTD